MHCVSTNVYSSTIMYTPITYYYSHYLLLTQYLLPICFLLSFSPTTRRHLNTRFCTT